MRASANHIPVPQVRILDLRRYRGVLRHRMGAEEPWTTVQGEFLMVWANNLPCERCQQAFPCLNRQALFLDRFVRAWFGCVCAWG